MIFPQVREAGVNRSLAGVIRDQAGIIRNTFDPLAFDPVLAYLAASGMRDGSNDPAGDGTLAASIINAGSGGSAASNAVALNQPVARVPVSGGHLHLPGSASNYAQIPFTDEIDSFTINFTVDQIVDGSSPYGYLWGTVGAGNSYIGITVGQGTSAFPSETLSLFTSATHRMRISTQTLNPGTVYDLTLTWDGSNYVPASSTLGISVLHSGVSSKIQGTAIQLGRCEAGVAYVGGKVLNSSLNGDLIDFSKADHHATSFSSDAGTVTINQSGYNPAAIIRRPEFWLDGVNTFLDGTFDSAFTGGTLYAVYRPLGTGGSDPGMVFGSSKTAGDDDDGDGAGWVKRSGGNILCGRTGKSISHATAFSGPMIHAVSLDSEGIASNLNGAEQSSPGAYALDSNRFTIGAKSNGSTMKSALAVEALYLFASAKRPPLASMLAYLNTQHPS